MLVRRSVLLLTLQSFPLLERFELMLVRWSVLLLALQSAALLGAIGADVGASVGSSVGADVGATVGSSVGAAVGSVLVRRSVQMSALPSVPLLVRLEFMLVRCVSRFCCWRSRWHPYWS
jgi:hypothetical protein